MKTSNLPLLPKASPIPDPLITIQASNVTATTCRISWQVYGYWGGVDLYNGRAHVGQYSGGGSYEFTGLTSKTPYVFSVHPKTHGPGSPEGKSVPVTTARHKPSPPSFLEAFNQTSSEVSLFWGDGAVDGGEPRYELRRDNDLMEVPRHPPYKDTAPEQGRVHKYCMRTYDEEFNLSDPICVDVEFEDFTAPTVPTDLRTTNLGLIFSWDESSDSSGHVTYRVDQGVDHKLGETINTEFAIAGLVPGQRYEFGVTAFDPTGNESNRVFVQYPKVGIPFNVGEVNFPAKNQLPGFSGSVGSRFTPTPPTYFKPFNHTASQVSFYWYGGEVETGEPRYELRRDNQLLEIPISPPYTDTDPQEGREHVYCIRTYDESFRYSEPVCVKVSFPDFTSPTDPSNLRTTDLGLTLTLEPSYDSSGNITYIVEQGGIESGRTKETEFAVTGLESGKRYTFSVRAVDGTGHESDRVSVHYPALGIPLPGKRVGSALLA